MIWVAQLRRDHPDEFIATMRSFGVSLTDLADLADEDGILPPRLWAELAALARVAVADTTTYLGAKVAKWAYRATMADVVSIGAAAGKRADQFMPWRLYEDAEARAARRVSATEVLVAQQQLARVSAFRHMEGFGGQ